MSGTNGSVALKDGTTTVDLVGYGSATLREGTATPRPDQLHVSEPQRGRH